MALEEWMEGPSFMEAVEREGRKRPRCLGRRLAGIAEFSNRVKLEGAPMEGSEYWNYQALRALYSIFILKP